MVTYYFCVGVDIGLKVGSELGTADGISVMIIFGRVAFVGLKVGTEIGAKDGKSVLIL